MEKLSLKELKERYEKGERDFSNSDMRMQTFDNLQFSGCNFSGSNLSFSSFRSTNFSGCNFTGANLEWSNFTRANLDNTDFTGAKAWYSNYSDATVKDAIFTNADFSYSLMLNVERNYKDITGTQFHMAVWHESELRPDVVQDVQLQLMSSRGLISEDVYTRLTFVIHSTMEQAEKVNLEDQPRGAYSVNVGGLGAGYKISSGTVGGAYAASGIDSSSAYLGKRGVYNK